MTPYRTQATLPPAPPPLSLHEKAGIAWTILGPGTKRVGKIVGWLIVGAMLVISVLYGVGWLFHRVAPNATPYPGSSTAEFIGDGFVMLLYLVVILAISAVFVAAGGTIVYTGIVKPLLQGPIAKIKEEIKTAEEQRKR
jgi:hypothetical protein